ncbi:MAG TPA: phage/plasmid replication protein [Pyrinomonadaceae bacterium]|jgi:hypothetical protein
MLDTLGTKHYFPILPCDDFKDSWKFLSKKKNPTWILNNKGAETLPNLTIVNTPNGLWHLSAQVSLPKLLFGHNARLPNQTEVNHGLKLMAEYAEEKSGLPFDAQTATVSLIHFANDIHLTEPEVWRMIERLSKKKLKLLRKQFFEDSTLYFTSRGRTSQIRIYPKLQAVLSEKNATDEAISCADGNLRFEKCYLEKNAIDSLVKRLGLPDSKARTLLTEKVSDLVLSELLESLNFFELLTREKTELDRLRESFPMKKAYSLRGFLEAVKEYGENFYKDSRHKLSKSSYCRNVRDCRKAKTW